MKLQAMNRFKDYYENFYVEQAEIVLSEVGLSDVYFVEKNRFEEIEKRYVTRDYLLHVLNRGFKTVVTTLNNVRFANFELYEESE